MKYTIIVFSSLTLHSFFFFFFEGEICKFIEINWLNQPEVHEKLVVELPPSTLKNLEC